MHSPEWTPQARAARRQVAQHSTHFSLGETMSGPYLEVLLDSLLIEALGQDPPPPPPLQLVAQGHLVGGSAVLLGDGVRDPLLRENGAVFFYPGNKNREPQIEGWS